MPDGLLETLHALPVRQNGFRVQGNGVERTLTDLSGSLGEPFWGLGPQGVALAQMVHVDVPDDREHPCLEAQRPVEELEALESSREGVLEYVLRLVRSAGQV